MVICCYFKIVLLSIVSSLVISFTMNGKKARNSANISDGSFCVLELLLLLSHHVYIYQYYCIVFYILS
jgi:hypothetical protein